MIGYFVPENKIKETEYLSPSGKYKLIVEEYSTKPGCWSYTRGIFSKDNIIADVK